jgi:hypothetical protein
VDVARPSADVLPLGGAGEIPNFALRLARTSAFSAGTVELTARADALVPPLSGAEGLVLGVLEAGAGTST